MPRVEICRNDYFQNDRIGGTYTTGKRVIQVPHRTLNTGNVVESLSHELGHAEAERVSVFDQSFQGHGVGWMRIMIEAGLGHEAERTTAFHPGALQAFRVAQQQINGSRLLKEPWQVVGGNRQRLETYEIPGCMPR